MKLRTYRGNEVNIIFKILLLLGWSYKFLYSGVYLYIFVYFSLISIYPGI